MDMEDEGDEGLREEETMVGKEGSVLMGFYLGGQDTAHGPGQAHCPRWASLVAQMVKNLRAMFEVWVRSQGWEDPLEESMATHSSILAWRIPMDRGAWWATVHRVTKSWTRLSD